MFQKKDSKSYQSTPTQGLHMRTLVHGTKTLMAEFKLEKGITLPLSSYPQETTGYMVSGKAKLYIGKEECLVEPGDAWCIPGDVEHHAEIIEDTIAIEVYSPVREEFIP